MEDDINDIADALTAITTTGGRGNFTIIHADREKNIYAQFAASPGNPRLYGELVGNEFIEGGAQLDGAAIARIEAHGWGGGGNFSKTWNVQDPGFDARAVAAEVAGILRNVYGTDPGRELEIETILE